MGNPYDEYISDEQGPATWHVPFVWSALLLLGWVVYELTAQPALGAFAVCVKFGWNDFRSAWWLRRIDPERGRAKACFWLYTASGLWKTALSGVVFMLTIAVFLKPQAALQGMQAVLGGHFAGAALATFFGFSLSSFATYLAFWCAFRNRVRVWLDLRMDRARRAQVWPSLHPAIGRGNYVSLLFVTAILLGMFMGTIVICFVAVLIRDAGIAGLVVGAAIISAAITLGALSNLTETRLKARSPQECWGTVAPQPAGADLSEEAVGERW
jgi:hypothetical protein